MKPLLLIDVDGTLNCFPQPTFQQVMEDPADWREATAATQGRTYKIWWRESLAGFMGELHRKELADWLWLTTWEQDARSEIAPLLGLPDFPALPHSEGQARPGPDWWKWLQVRKLWEEELRPIVWLDDDITEEVREWAEELMGDSCLLINPASNPSLTVEDWHRVEEFLLSHV